MSRSSLAAVGAESPTITEAGRSCVLCGGDDKTVRLRKNGYRVARCSCGMIYADREPSAIDFDELYRERYPPEAFLPQRGRKVRNSHRELAELEARTPGRRLLDVGSSYGFFLATAVRRGWSAAGVEPSASAASFGRDRYGLDVHTGYLAAAPYPPNSFDVVTIRHVLEHAPYPMQLLAEARSMLRVGGLLLAAVPNQESLAARALGSEWWWVDPPTHLSYFTADTLAQAVERSGFHELHHHTARGDDEHIGFYLAFLANHLVRGVSRGGLESGSGARPAAIIKRRDRWTPVRRFVEAAAIPLRPVGAALDSFGLGSELVMISRLE